jgi:predicted phage terminase large subunit-like protein
MGLAELKKEVRPDAWRLMFWKYAEEMSKQRKPWLPYAWSLDMAKRIQRTVLKPNGRLILNAPPRHGKSFTTSHWLPTWYLDMWPKRRIGFTSYGGDFASDWGKSVRDEFLMNNNTWTKLRTDSKARGSWLTTEDGGMKCAGVGGPLTGRGFDLVIIDDPHKNWEEAMSPQARERVIEWFNATLYTRLEPGAVIIVIQTRWHESDLTGYLINEHRDDWEVIRYPALAEDDSDILGRKEGEALCPERFTAERLEDMKATMGSYIFAGLYQQRPAPLQGGMVSKDWFKFHEPAITANNIKFDEVIQTWDLQFKATGTSYVVGQVWGRKGADAYLLDQKRAKMGFNEQMRAIAVMSARWPDAHTKYIEDAADAQAVKSTLQNEIPGIVLLPAKGSKEANLAAVVGMIESGNVYLPLGVDWLESYLIELSTFPNAVNDDQVDATSMALKKLQKNNASNILFNIPQTGTRESPWRF